MKKAKIFRIWPDNGSLFFRVYIHPSKSEMYRHSAKPHNHSAICQNGYRFYVPKNGEPRFIGEIGEIHFTKQSFRAGVIAHELTHATFGYFRWRASYSPLKFRKSRRGMVSAEEEAFCWVQGNLYRQSCISANGKEYRPRGPVLRIIRDVKASELKIKME